MNENANKTINTHGSSFTVRSNPRLCGREKNRCTVDGFPFVTSGAMAGIDKPNDMYSILSGIGRKKQSKYRALRTANGDGTFSDSRKEARLDAQFMAMANAKGVLRVVRKERFAFILNGLKICAYESDWTVYHKDGRKEVFDAKGVKTAVYIIKKKMMKAFYGIDIQEV